MGDLQVGTPQKKITLPRTVNGTDTEGGGTPAIVNYPLGGLGLRSPPPVNIYAWEEGAL